MNECSAYVGLDVHKEWRIRQFAPPANRARQEPGCSRRTVVFGDNGGVIGPGSGAMLGFLKGLFGGGAGAREPEPSDPVEYEGFTIVATPRRAGSGWSTEGRIRKDVGGETKEVHFIRADTSPSRDAAVTLSVGKARKIIDERGEQVFRASRA